MANTRNERLRAARERMPSRLVPGEPMSRAELAKAVNEYLWRATGQRFDLDGHHVAKYERAVVRYPIAPYRAALRAVLAAATDLELGFSPPARLRPETAPGLSGGSWTVTSILDAADDVTGSALIHRRDALKTGLAATGAAILGPLAAGWLEPLAGWSGRGGSFSAAEVEALEHLLNMFRDWRATGSGITVSAVVGQLGDVTDRLRGTADSPLTRRAYLAAAELAKLSASMYFDAGAHPSASRFYVLAVQLSKPAEQPSFAATTIAAMARQSFDTGAPGDGLELVHLAQHGTRDTATPRLRTMLATRAAWGHAQLGEVYGFRRAVDAAETAFADVAQEAEPRWLAGLDAAELAGTIGARFRDLAHHDPEQARRAVDYIGRALELRDPGRTRNRLLDTIGLARTHLLTGEVDESCALVDSVVPLVDTAHPGRVARKLDDWSCEAGTRYGDDAMVRETRHRVRQLVIAG